MIDIKTSQPINWEGITTPEQRYSKNPVRRLFEMSGLSVPVENITYNGPLIDISLANAKITHPTQRTVSWQGFKNLSLGMGESICITDLSYNSETEIWGATNANKFTNLKDKVGGVYNYNGNLLNSTRKLTLSKEKYPAEKAMSDLLTLANLQTNYGVAVLRDLIQQVSNFEQSSLPWNRFRVELSAFSQFQSGKNGPLPLRLGMGESGRLIVKGSPGEVAVYAKI